MKLINRIYSLVAVFLCLFLQEHIFAKDRNGDPFRVFFGLTFPQLGSTNDLNSLQVLAVPLVGEPYSLHPPSIGKSAIHFFNDDPRDLLKVFSIDKPIIESLSEMDQKKLTTGSSIGPIWSPFLFPTARGGVANRYRIHQEPELGWPELNLLHKDLTAQDLISQNKINLLSPMEKYEFLVGNTEFNLSKSEWSIGQEYLDRFYEVPGWIGICHGSAPASYNSLKPQKTIRVRAHNNEVITFYPTDLKALIAFSWAKAGGASAVMGGRCGKYLRPGIRPSLNCLDNNPASFHIAMINHVGLNQRPLIIDSSAGPEVWNKVVKSYEYSYFKVGTRNLNSQLNLSQTDVGSYPKDPYKKYRASETSTLVGVSMVVTYMLDRQVSSIDLHNESEEEFEKIRYWYDLELNHLGDIVGGEWHNQVHPDFMWVVSPSYKPRTIYDYAIDGRMNSYNGEQTLSPFIQSQAKKAALEGHVLYELIDRLILLSQ